MDLVVVAEVMQVVVIVEVAVVVDVVVDNVDPSKGNLKCLITTIVTIYFENI
jgi:hypothetical protein